jgi:hypothetical protein
MSAHKPPLALRKEMYTPRKQLRKNLIEVQNAQKRHHDIH